MEDPRTGSNQLDHPISGNDSSVEFNIEILIEIQSILIKYKINLIKHFATLVNSNVNGMVL